ncbi:hypothetical protein Spa11_27920 [Botrimarina mediterranea]|uniref:PEP-CTERM protein-sorting domain-containing protein n=1 Tax=Botrimarina mediterranea TaxID=2528022 RepID=A0A518K9X3_9BACT|nr:hypothetical protein Spa11_27920 [Botrimarina mediterranea]
MQITRYSCLTLLLIATSSVGNAATLSQNVTFPTVAGTPAGYKVNDLSIDFTGQLFGQQMVVELTSGSIYQNASFGAETAPNDALIPIFPEVASDTFVTIGGFTRNTSSSVLVVGGSTELAGFAGPKKFDTAGINIAWAPAPGVVINGGNDFPIARITLSDNANGTVHLFSNSGGQGVVWSRQIIQGNLFGLIDPPDPDPIFPEPSSAMLTWFLLFACALHCGKRDQVRIGRTSLN